MTKNYLVYYQIKKTKEYVIIYSDEPKKVYTADRLPAFQEYHRYSMLKSSGLEASVDGLRKYFILFNQWCDQLLENKSMPDLGFDYRRYLSDNKAVKRFFYQLQQNKEKYVHENIDAIESSWIERCNNAGLLYHQKGEFDCYGYDFSFNYPTILASRDFFFPYRKKDKPEMILKKVAEKPSNIQVGFYHCKIQCNDDNFRKIFAFSRNNVYTHYDMRFAKQHQEQFNVKMELVQDGLPNHYQYDKDAMVKGNDIFWLWYDKLTLLRKEFPDNKLIKFLASSLWGSLSEKVFFTRTEKQIEEDENIQLGETFDIVDMNLDSEGNTKSYKLVKLDKMYDSNYRLKPFITAFARNKTGRLALQDVNSVVRVNTDCVVFTKKQKINDASLKVDAKWTGRLNIIHTNEYVSCC